MPNRLADETSPYLLQHADNPVDWYPWGPEAFERARAEDKPVLLSVGYSACHWCHVMAHESFEKLEIANLMNDWFVNIKVDREERPDVDSVYMAAVQATTGQGGWPMTVFLTPDAKPFYAGTYFPPEDGHGRPGFPRVLEALHDAWSTERERLLSGADGITDQLRAASARSGQEPARIAPETLDAVVQNFRGIFDPVYGGFGDAPKFPSPSNLEFLLAYHARTGVDSKSNLSALGMVLQSLHGMATGGIYDQLGGGFARYSVDRRWMVPHFEKMLYDNVQLIRVYLHAYQLTSDPFYRRIVDETVAYLEREMLDPEGAFHAAQDADSEGIEGKFFLWTQGEIERVLGRDAALFVACFGVTPQGNFTDPHHPELLYRNVLSRRYDPAEIAARFDLPESEIDGRLEPLRQRLFEARSERIPPGLDDKILTSWNGLALAALAEAGRVLDDAHYRELAERLAAFLREKVWIDGRLSHTYKAGRARFDGLLEDYAYVGLGLGELYKLTGDLEHLSWATELFDVIDDRFHDDEGGAFFSSPADGESLLFRQKEYFDAATPSGNGAAALLALWLGRYYAQDSCDVDAAEVIGQVADHLEQASIGFGAILQAGEFLLAPHRELAIVGDAAARAPLEREVAGRFLPFIALAPSDSGQGLPLFEGREATGAALAYLCEDRVCGLPASTPEELAAQLDALIDGPAPSA